MPDYKQDPNDSTKQVAGNLPDSATDNTVTPLRGTLTKTPNAVLIGGIQDNIGFFFGTSASFSETATTDQSPAVGNQITGSQYFTSFGTPAAGTTLNIHPTAWSGSARDADKVIFLYKSGLATGGF
jgi:hypothetical protein